MVYQKEKKSDEFILPLEKYKVIVNNVIDIVIEIDLNGTFTYVSPQSKQILGYSPSEVIGRKALRYVHPDDLRGVMKVMDEAIRTRTHLSFEYRAKHKEGYYIHVYAKGGIVEVDEQERLVGIVRDNTDKKLAEETLNESKEKYRNLFEKSPILIFLVDIGGKIIDYNDTAVNFISYTRDELIGKNFQDLNINSPSTMEILKNKFKEVLKCGKLGPIEFKIDTPKVKLKWIRLQASLVNLGKKIIIQVLIENISEKKETEKLLLESEKNYRNIIENTKEAVVIIDLNGNLTYTSPQLSDILKGKKFSQTSRFFKDIHREDVGKVIKFFKKVIIQKNVPEEILEFRILDNKGNYIWLSSTPKNYYNDKGESIGFITTLREITDKIMAEKKLQESEERYRLITENSNDLIRVLDEDFRVEYLNRHTHSQILGYTEEDLIGEHDIILNHPEDYPLVRRRMLTLFKKKELVYESRMKHKNGNWIWFEVKAKMFKDDKGNQKYLFISRDITERKLAEKRIKESEQKFKNLYENSPNAIVVTDFYGKILDQNSAVEKIFEYKLEETKGKYFGNFDIFSNEQILLIRKGIKEQIKGVKVPPIELCVKNKHGKEKWITHQTSVINLEDELIIETIIQDITERKKAEEIIKDENRRLLELNTMKNELVSRVSHELKTPLNSIYGGAQILIELYKDKTCNEAQEFIEMIYKGGKRLKILVENLLDISRIDSGKLKLNLKRSDIVQIIKECVEEAKYLINQRNLNINLDLPFNLYLEVDMIRIGQVITNLLSNAVKNTPNNGLINIKLTDMDNSILISIEDSGVGLTSNEMEKLFKKFGKIERYGQMMDVDIEGTGLGLYISKEIVDLHGGIIWVESEGQNKGAIFKVKLFKNPDLLLR
ncbi:MAG: PAS domain S-box protein [Candidatus Lokiarchaeota archaeon]|nr:PAS domain S-box protein [Candidatus Lokiarchaeota archaeon]